MIRSSTRYRPLIYYYFRAAILLPAHATSLILMLVHATTPARTNIVACLPPLLSFIVDVAEYDISRRLMECRYDLQTLIKMVAARCQRA